MRKIGFVIYCALAFYVPLLLAHRLLPKWWDILFGLVGVWAALYYGLAWFIKLERRSKEKEFVPNPR